MNEHILYDLALACHRLAQQLSEDNEELNRTTSSRKFKAQKEALHVLLHLGGQRPYSWDEITDPLWTLYTSSPVQSKTRHQIATMLLDWSKRRDLPFGDAVEAAQILYRMSQKESTEKQQAIEMLLTQARWPGISMRQAVEAATALCYASPVRSRERNQGIEVLFEVAQRPHLSVEDALAFITLDSGFMAIIDTPSALLKKRQLAVRKQMLETLSLRSDLTSEQTAQIAEALSAFGEAQA